MLVLLLALLFAGTVVRSQNCSTTLPDGSDCPSDTDYQLFEDPEDCSSFYECSGQTNGCPKHFKCERDYLFNPVAEACAENYKVDCGERPCPDPIHCPSEHPTTGVPPTTQTSPPDCGHVLDCSGLADNYYADQYNCRKYWHCFEGEGEHLICRDSLLYDPVHVWCDFPDRVDCGDRPVCDECDEGCFTATHTSQTPSPSECSQECSEDGLFPEACCDNSFCQCFGGIGYLQHCQPGLFFNENTHTCDFPFNIPCCQA